MQLTGEVVSKHVEEYQRQAGDFKETARRGNVQVSCSTEKNEGATLVLNVGLDGKAAKNLDEFTVGQSVTVTIATS